MQNRGSVVKSISTPLRARPRMGLDLLTACKYRCICKLIQGPVWGGALTVYNSYRVTWQDNLRDTLDLDPKTAQ